MIEPNVAKPRFRHALGVVLGTLVALGVVAWLGSRAPAFATFIHLGELVIVISGAITLYHALRPRTHQRRSGDRRHSDRRKVSR